MTGPPRSRALETHGYTMRPLDGDETLTARRMGDLVEDLLTELGPHDLAVVHVISHGEDGFGSVRVVGADGRATSRTDLNSWLTDASSTAEQDGEDDDLPLGPTVLFLVDVCGAGQAARLAWQAGIADERRRAWVLTGGMPRHPSLPTVVG
ncbi:hypothetical protein ACFPIJ_56125 [Dactylosporangium cerinum]|uniref:Uncharacterized protein n=1 Tax=Dactylosporangium cerinum TaxID=1434730 RepID=A0ABV9WEF4_9ACTN